MAIGNLCFISQKYPCLWIGCGIEIPADPADPEGDSTISVPVWQKLPGTVRWDVQPDLTEPTPVLNCDTDGLEIDPFPATAKYSLEMDTTLCCQVGKWIYDWIMVDGNPAQTRCFCFAAHWSKNYEPAAATDITQQPPGAIRGCGVWDPPGLGIDGSNNNTAAQGTFTGRLNLIRFPVSTASPTGACSGTTNVPCDCAPTNAVFQERLSAQSVVQVLEEKAASDKAAIDKAKSK